MNILNKAIQYYKSTHQMKHLCVTILIFSIFLASCGTVNDVSSSGNEYGITAAESSNTVIEETITASNNLNVDTEHQSDKEIKTELGSEINNDTEEITSSSEEENENLAELQVHFIDVGQGDCTLISCGSESMLIDAGDNNQGTNVQNYLQKQGIESLKYVICTHPDSDHIGGMDVILYKFDCETIFMTDEEKDTNTYRDVIDTMKGKGYKNTLPIVGESYSLEDAEFTILSPSQLSDDSNNNSISIILTHGNNNFFFTGDAESEEESDILNSGISIDADVYKVGHHGSSSSSSMELLESVSPTYAVISCGEENSYGHPHSETLNVLRAMGVKVFRTDEQGSIIAVSDGEDITWNCSPSDTWKAGENTQHSDNSDNSTEYSTASSSTNVTEIVPTEVETVEESTFAVEHSETSNTTTYIGNKNTKKFHYPSCSSVDQMKESNKLTVDATRDEMINQGYVPCKKCNP